MTAEPGVRPSRLARQADRRDALGGAVLAAGTVRIEDLAAQFGVSVMTVHRDLDQLESQGVLRKLRGVATASPAGEADADREFESRRAEKEALARACGEFIEPGQALLLDDSTTVRHLAPVLRAKAPLTVITNALPLINELRKAARITLVALGGTYHPWPSSFLGRNTLDEIGQLHADLFVTSAPAIVDGVGFHRRLEAVGVERAMFESSAKRILLADHAKFERRALYALAPLADFDVVITDWGTPAGQVARLRNRGVNLVVAPPEGPTGTD
ncbi:MAG: DeoR/GlpR family DNA-binding transcription regulator [Bifidobacteriaceae bacterium]|jgi:DeoR/GlpR family transcriptional regulator of sugar metabolism|nr:DeoR/GlpR family DNA-binding transcription regulator [Bifidobacteriaceae bacterium]